ncbi:macrolide 2'-phosphotransferase [Paenibacillus tepidiphilus]|uniref:macrolide 2'-phosphotransferase n=1 Tax=Paenibacillus tepidiphilus TaxID=2608683 RepID=UPI001239D74D|nr:macrolide 2'-phosphotransferase [Paenibacillus tepidiphilus]
MTTEQWMELARENGLSLRQESIRLNDTGMDFRVAFVEDEDGQDWVLRVPRRPDVWERAVNERKVLAVVSGHLPVAVPDWRIFTPGLIAYPLLEGEPVAAVDPAGGGYLWQFPQEELTDIFYGSLAEALAALHNIGQEEAVQAGIHRKTPQEVRAEYAADMEEIRQSFPVPEVLYARWKAWLDTDSYWPEHSAFIHGDMHPPHILVDRSQRVTGVIDWTEAVIADPGTDFVILFGLFGEAGLRRLLERYEQAGGQTWPRMYEHIAERWAAYPVLVAKFALLSGEEAVMELARGMIAAGAAEA